MKVLMLCCLTAAVVWLGWDDVDLRAVDPPA